MADENQTVIKYIDLEGLGVYDDLIKSHIAQEDAKSLKTVVIEGTKLKFYRVSEPLAEGAEAAYEIQLPETDISPLMHKLTGTKGNVVVVGDNGEVADSEIALSDLATQDYVDGKVAEEIGKSQHLIKQVVTELPSDTDAKENVIYLIKDTEATGDDVYKEYLLIDSVLTCIGDTSTDLSNVYTKDIVDGKIATAKSEAVSEATTAAAEDATTKADTAETNAKSYTDQEVTKDRERLDADEADIDTLQSDTSDLKDTTKQHTDRIEALEATVGNYTIATEEEIKAMFNKETA